MATSEPITIHVGTRRSALALKQVDKVTEWLQKAHPHLKVEVHPVSVAGDRDKTTPLPTLGKGLWTTELEAQLLSKELDVIVHCLKDMPTTLPEGCAIGAVPAREDPRDVAIFKDQQKHSKLADLLSGSIVGTSSLRRAAQLRKKYPGLVFKDIRGNIDTRLRKLETEDFDCIILAAAGMLRMGFGARIGQYLDADNGTLYAVGQGALALEVRKDDDRTLGVLQCLADQPTTLATQAERSVMRTLEGGCSVPIGVETSWMDSESGPKKLRLHAMVISVDGTTAVETERTEEVSAAVEADDFGRKVAQDLIDKGARAILDVINKGRDNNPAAVKVGDA